jgi:hypothetical protein
VKCLACEIEGALLCPDCEDVRALAAVFEPETLALVVDGSFAVGTCGLYGGAGLVLSSMGEVIATKALGFPCKSSKDAEYRAITIGLRWAPGADVYSDCEPAIATAERQFRRPHILQAWHLTRAPNIVFLPKIARYPLHVKAHQLANEGRRAYAARFEEEAHLARAHAV